MAEWEAEARVGKVSGGIWRCHVSGGREIAEWEAESWLETVCARVGGGSLGGQSKWRDVEVSSEWGKRNRRIGGRILVREGKCPSWRRKLGCGKQLEGCGGVI
jgi:hypothetical protein